MSPARTRLASIELTGSRALVRRCGFVALAVAAAITFVGYLLPAHRLVFVPRTGRYLDLSAQEGELHFHSNFADGGPMPLCVLLFAFIAIVLLRQRRAIGAGMIAGVFAAGAAVLSVGSVLLAHLLSRYESAVGEAVFAGGVLVLFFGGAVMFFGEPILYLLERRRIERATRPAPLPVARVY